MSACSVVGNRTQKVLSLKDLKHKNPENIILSYININSVRNKLDNLVTFLDGSVDILSIAETKIDSSFPESQFCLKGFKKPYRLDWSDTSGGLLTYIRSDIPSRLVKTNKDYQVLFVELNLRKQKWLLFIIYRNPSSSINLDQYLQFLSDAFDMYSSTYDNILIAGDFNAEPSSANLKTFLETHALYSHINENTCFKSEKGSCIDLILSNQKYSFQHSGTVETGISDYHSMIYTMFKAKFKKTEPKVIKYRDYKNFSLVNFLHDLNIYLNDNLTFNNFNYIFQQIIDHHAPFKTKLLRANNKPHVTKTLRKAIMKRSHLKNIANKTKNEVDKSNYRRQRNLVVKLNRKEKKTYIDKLDPKQGKSFWKTIKPLFSNKNKNVNESIQLLEGDLMIDDSQEIASIFNNFFNQITDSLKIPQWSNDNNYILDNNNLDNICEYYLSHPSIVAIKQVSPLGPLATFKFKEVSSKQVSKIILSLDHSKSVGGLIPVKLLKLGVERCSPILATLFNSAIKTGVFPHELKLADIIPCHKKDSTLEKSNYRPISLLPTISKVFERLMVNQMLPFLNTFLSKFLCGFRKGHSTQHALLNLLRRWQNHLSTGDKVGALLIDLSKAFDVLPHNLMLAKLQAYGFESSSLNLIQSYLFNRKHRVRISSIFSEWLTVKSGVPQGSVLGPILFNVFINDMFIIFNEDDICNFADDNTLSETGKTLEIVYTKLSKKSKLMLDWFANNSLVANSAKFQVIFPGSPKCNISLIINGNIIDSSEIVKLLGVLIDDKLCFYPHLLDLTSNVNNKIKALMRIRTILSQEKRDILYFTFIMSIFNYCPLIWMFCSKTAHALINKTHYRALKARFSNFTESFEELLVRSNSIKIHDRNIKLMLCEVFKSQKKLGPEILHDIFETKQIPYVLRSGDLLEIPNYAYTDSFDFRATMTWNEIPSVIKSAETLSDFKNKLDEINISCRCNYCR